MKKVFLIAAARPNFMKIAPLWRELKHESQILEPFLIHTGQHYDKNMSDVFFSDLGLPAPDVHLGVGGGSHAEQTAGVMLKFEQLCLQEKPDIVLVVGDVNATMAASVVASKLHIPVAHVEAGLRSKDMSMPEEINRLITDAIADLLLTPSPDANANLLKEGVSGNRIHLVGNIMIDTLVKSLEKVSGMDTTSRFGLKEGAFGVVTLHRPSNVDDAGNLARILTILAQVEMPLVFPVHPRTRTVIDHNDLFAKYGLGDSRLQLVEPLGYYEFMSLVTRCRLMLTDSGGLQEETTYLGIPCITLRPNTERPITITEGTNELATIESLPEQVARVMDGKWKEGKVPNLWDGRTAPRVIQVLEDFLS